MADLRPTARRRPRRRARRPGRSRRAGALGLHARVARRRTSRSSTATSPGLGDYEGSETLDATGPLRRARASSTRTCTSSRRSCSSDEFARLVLPLGTTAVVADPHEIANVLGTDGVHWLLDVCGRTCRSTSSSWRRRACPRRSSSRRGARSRRRPRGAAAPAPRARPRRDDELPRRHRRRRARAGEAAAAGAEHVDGHAPGVLGKRPERVRRGRDPLRPRGVDGRGGARAAARRDVAADPRGVGGAQPARAAAAASPSTARAGSRSAPTTASPSTSPTTGTSTRWCATRSRSGVAPEDALVMRVAQPGARGTGCRTSARSRPATRPTCSAARPRVVRAGARAEGAGGRSARSPRARRCRTGCGRRCAIGALGAGRLPHPVGGRRGARDRARPRTRSSRSRSSRSRPCATARRSPTRSATWRRSP